MQFCLRIFSIHLMLMCIDLVIFISYKKTKQQNTKNHDNIINHQAINAISEESVASNSLFNKLYFEKNIFNVFEKEQQPKEDIKIIVLYNVPEYMSHIAKRDIVYTDCEYHNCIISRNKSKLFIADAVIFYIGIRNERMGSEPSLQLKQRNENQVWIFTSGEPPEHYYNTDFWSKSWENTMNWSSLYRLDSDIPNPYGCLIRQNTHNRYDYESIYNAKTKNALWIVSHCHVASERRLYVQQMIKSGFDVDILGGCSSDGNKISKEQIETIIPKYKYFLAFENSFCEDYISEKFFQNYNFSWIIVARGGADYQRLLPEDTFINTDDFLNISSLVQFLTNIGNDKTKYIAFLQKKDHFFSIRWPGNRNCEICRRLNNISQFKKAYKNIAVYLTDRQCHRSTDL